MTDTRDESAVDSAAETFVAELHHWREVAGLSMSGLANKAGYDASYVSKIEGGKTRPTEGFAARADDVLRAGGALRRRYEEYEAAARRTGKLSTGAHEYPGAAPPPATGGLVVEHDDAELRYDGTVYQAHMRRRLRNDGPDPVTRYLIRISVDRHPGDPVRSNELYRQQPLEWDALHLKASSAGEPMSWEVKHDRDAFKEVWLLFENERGRFPLYPGESTWIEYRYDVGDEQWGQWFQRAVRLPTRRLSVSLRFPAELQPTVWGMETSMTAEASALRTAIRQQLEGDDVVYTWATDEPPLHARYRLEWRFRGREAEQQAAGADVKPSDRMRELGIVQEGDPILRQVATPFDLPAEAEDARRLVAQLQAATERVSQVHTFSKGLGIAAPQIGVSRAAALIRPPDGPPIVLLNPRVVEESPQTDEQYEGCLSFFDVRGSVPRPLTLHVEHQNTTGQRRITIFEQGVARLVAHEIDHLKGRLYIDRLDDGNVVIPVERYRGSGMAWSYRSRQLPT